MAGRPRKIAEKYARYSTPEAIMLAAEELVALNGPGGLKMSDIASEVGIEAASIYNHYKGIGGVLSSLIARSLAEQIELRDLPADLDAEEAIREYFLRSTRYFATRSGIARLTINDFAEVHHSDPNAFDRNEETIVRLIDGEAKILGRHPGFSHFSRSKLGEISVSGQAMILMLLGLTWINGKETDEPRIQEVATFVADMILSYADRHSETS